ncbi:MAG: hypothetical protein AAF650_00260 [Pseudomonadota bacterium]
MAQSGTLLKRLRAVGAAVFLGAAAFFSGAAFAQNAKLIETDWELKPSARVEFGAVSAETATRDESIIVNGDAFTVRAQASLVIEDEDTRIRLEVDRVEVFRLDDERDDVNRDRITADFNQELNEDFELQLRARYYDDLITAESADTDEIQGSARITYEPERAHRLRVRGSWREREYDRGTGGQTTGQGPRIDVNYRHRLGRYHYANLDLRAESIDSDDPRRGYSRQSVKVSYTQPITRDARVRPAFQYLNTRFDNRLNQDGERRHDQLVVPEVEFHWWPGKWRVEAEAKYLFTSSNLPSRQREGYRLTLSVGYVF